MHIPTNDTVGSGLDVHSAYSLMSCCSKQKDVKEQCMLTSTNKSMPNADTVQQQPAQVCMHLQKLKQPRGGCVQPVADLFPLPADLALVLLNPDIGVYTLATDQLKVAIAPISLLVFQRVHHRKIVLRTPVCSSCCVHSMLRSMLQYNKALGMWAMVV